MMILQNKNMSQLVCHLNVDTAVENTKLYCYNKEGDRNSVVSQASCRIDVTRLEPNLHILKSVVIDFFYKVGRGRLGGLL